MQACGDCFLSSAFVTLTILSDAISRSPFSCKVLSACAVSGVLGRRGFAVETTAARICREVGARVMVNVFVRDLDLGVVDRLDARRLEIVADGLPLFGGAQLAIDTTLVSAIRQDGTPIRGAATRDGVALAEARRRKARTYPELTPGWKGSSGGAGNRGRWSNETASFLSSLAHAESREVAAEMQESARATWRRRWASMLSCAAARACALSLLDLRASPRADGDVPIVHDVVGDHRF